MWKPDARRLLLAEVAALRRYICCGSRPKPGPAAQPVPMHHQAANTDAGSLAARCAAPVGGSRPKRRRSRPRNLPGRAARSGAARNIANSMLALLQTPDTGLG